MSEGAAKRPSGSNRFDSDPFSDAFSSSSSSDKNNSKVNYISHRVLGFY